MTTPDKPRDVSSRRVLLISTAPAIVEPQGRGLRFSGPGFQGLRTPDSAPWFDGHTPPGPVGPSSDREIGRLTNASWNQRAGGIAGTLSIFPAGVTSAADRQRGLIPGGSDRLSIRYYPIGENAEIRGVDGAVDVLHWGISHVASVGEPADISAGNELGSAAGYDLEVALHWIDDSEDNMTTPILDLTTALPLIANAVAEGVKLANQSNELAAQTAAADQLTKMAQIAASQAELYDSTELARLGMDLAQGMIKTPDDFRAKLESIQINPKPIAPGLSNEGEISGLEYGQMLADWWSHKTPHGEAWNRTQDIMAASKVKTMAAPGSIAVDMQAFSAMQRDLVTTTAATGTGAAGDTIETGLQLFYDATDRDPLDLWSLIDLIPGGAGTVKMTALTLPTPGWQSEPTSDSGYTKGTDASAASNDLTPKLLISLTNVTRLLDVLTPQYWVELAMVAFAAMQEQLNRGLLETASTDAPIGLYDFPGVGSSAELTAAPTAAVVGTALQASALSSYGNRRMVMQHGVWQSLRNVARPAGVAPLVDPATGRFGVIDSVPLEVTGLWTASKLFRGISGPWENVVGRLWDGAFYFSERYENGVRWMLVEGFVDWRPRHPALFSRWRQD